ncbi:Calmodulin and related proteins (EF-Hand superfamily) [Handroanthus impetiginosus]|uniref:Calmodulin and related proteins (EF-Hand superfamily) n=1 Tax=Handroanthus impetiginosus TaxID=429701 RepID=A0A2G9I203_9LAMI|nr:Calmodulin and related proteins (EF-Hand superfamily) [Handroanthus impetiginosus]
MLASIKLCLRSQFKRARNVLEKLNLSKKFRSWKRSTQNRASLTSDLSWLLTSSYSAMEVSTQLRQVFKLIDTNGDGKLSPLELKQVLISLGHEKAEAAKEAEGMVKEMDFDGDGFVDLDEFLSAMGSDSANGIFRDSEIIEAFRVFDYDNNGLISAKELKKVLERVGCGKCSLRDCKKMVKGVDRNGDGFVDFEEFKVMMSDGY